MKKPAGNSNTWALALTFAALFLITSASLAQNADKPYDKKLYRLSELLGAIHYLRELCAAGEEQKWRNNMKALIEAEGISPARKAELSRRFNRGYRGYSRTYRSCTPSAKSTVDRFIAESIKITDELIKLAG